MDFGLTFLFFYPSRPWDGPSSLILENYGPQWIALSVSRRFPLPPLIDLQAGKLLVGAVTAVHFGQEFQLLEFCEGIQDGFDLLGEMHFGRIGNGEIHALCIWRTSGPPKPDWRGAHFACAISAIICGPTHFAEALSRTQSPRAVNSIASTFLMCL